MLFRSLPIRTGTMVSFAENLNRLPNEIKAVRPTFFLAPPRVWERMYSSIRTEVLKKSPLAQKAFYAALGLGLAALVTAIGLGLLLARSVATPIKAMTDAMRRLAAQDFAVEVPARGRADEVGQMAAAFQRMIEHLRELPTALAGMAARGRVPQRFTTRPTQPLTPAEPVLDAFSRNSSDACETAPETTLRDPTAEGIDGENTEFPMQPCVEGRV